MMMVIIGLACDGAMVACALDEKYGYSLCF